MKWQRGSSHCRNPAGKAWDIVWVMLALDTPGLLGPCQPLPSRCAVELLHAEGLQGTALPGTVPVRGEFKAAWPCGAALPAISSGHVFCRFGKVPIPPENSSGVQSSPYASIFTSLIKSKIRFHGFISLIRFSSPLVAALIMN